MIQKCYFLSDMYSCILNVMITILQHYLTAEHCDLRPNTKILKNLLCMAQGIQQQLQLSCRISHEELLESIDVFHWLG